MHHSRLTKIKDLLGQGSKTLAMSYLRSKKQLEELLTKRLGSQETLQTVLSRIESAATDIEVGHTLSNCPDSALPFLARS